MDAHRFLKLMDFGNSRYSSALNASNTAQSSDWNRSPELLKYRKGKTHAFSKRADFALPDACWDIPWLTCGC